MIAIVAALDSSNAVLLFHVEQPASIKAAHQEIRYRTRYPESRHESLRQWGDTRTLTHLPALVPLADPNVTIECEYQAGPLDSHWQRAAPHTFGVATCMMDVTFLQPRPLPADPEIHVMGVHGDFPALWSIVLPPRAFDAGDHITILARSLLPGPGQIAAPGSFRVRSARYHVVSQGHSQAALLPCSCAAPGLASPLGAVPAFVAFTGEKLSDGEIEILKSEVAAMEKEAARA